VLTQKRVLLLIYQIALFVGCLFLLVPDSLLRLPGVGLDRSWEIAINLAVQNHLRFGQDFVFTFGPLAVLWTRLPIGMNQWPLILFDAVLIGMIAAVLIYVLRRTPTYFAATLVFLTIVNLSAIPPQTYGLAHVLFLLFLFALFLHLSKGDPASLIGAGVISWLLFYLKANLGLAAVPLMVGFCIYLLARPRGLRRPAVAAFLVLYLAIGLALALPLNVELPGYVLGNLHLAASYNDAMALPFERDMPGDQYIYLALTIVVAYALAFVADRRQYVRNPDNIVRFLLTAVFIFLVFKHSFVRAITHYGYFYFIVPAAIGLLAVFASPEVRGRLTRVFLLTLILSFPFAAGSYTIDHLNTKLRHLRNYVYNASHAWPEPISSPEWETQRLPASTLDLIGDGTVDVIPWEISTVYINDLRYNPRPVIQSYTAYDAYLDTLNEEKYLSSLAPEYVIYAPGDIDGRHPLFIEPRTRQALLTHYQVIEETPGYLLLARRSQPITTTENVAETQAGRLGEFIPLADTQGLHYLSADIDYSLLGKLARTFYQPPLLNVTVEFEDGEQQEFRALKPLVNDQVLINPFFDTVQDAGAFFRSRGEQGRRVQRIRFNTEQPWGFQPGFTYHLKTVELPPPAWNSRDLDREMATGLNLKTVAASKDGDELDVRLTWNDSASFRPGGSSLPLTASAQLLDDAGNRLAGYDVLLQEGVEAVSFDNDSSQPSWQSRHVLKLPPNLPPGQYDLLVTLYTLAGDQLDHVSSVVAEDFIAVD
jgi:hypothetical protein